MSWTEKLNVTEGQQPGPSMYERYGRRLSPLEYFEWKMGLGPVAAAKLLGIDRRRYWEFKRGKREIPKYIRHSIAAHIVLPPSQRVKIMESRGIKKKPRT